MNSTTSIIIPVYNAEDYINKCIESCFNQSYTNIEIIAVNDGSTDNSGKILDELSKKDKRLKVVHKKNEGVTRARIIGIEKSMGIICFFWIQMIGLRIV